MPDWTTDNAGASRRVLVTKDLPGERWREILRSTDCEIRVSSSRSLLSTAEILAEIGDRCDGAIGQLTERWGDELFSALARAGGKVYSNYAVGYDNVDVPAATRHGIVVGNTPGVLTETTAELAVALTFAAARRIPESEAYLRAGRFEGWLPDLFLGKKLSGGTLGIVGAGRIGGAYAKMLAPGLGMDVLYWSRSRNEELERELLALAAAFVPAGARKPACERVADLDELLAAADVVSLHVPLDRTTRHLLNAERLARMKPDAVLVNTSRGAVIDERALVEHLRRTPDFRVGLDVFENEPALAPGLAELPNAVVVPHIGSATTWTRSGMATLAAANVAGVLRGDPLVDTLRVEDFLAGEPRRAVPSLINLEALVNPEALGGSS